MTSDKLTTWLSNIDILIDYTTIFSKTFIRRNRRRIKYKIDEYDRLQIWYNYINWNTRQRSDIYFTLHGYGNVVSNVEDKYLYVNISCGMEKYNIREGLDHLINYNFGVDNGLRK